MPKIVEKHRRILPHLQEEQHIIFITWRLAFTLPKALLDMQTSLQNLLEEIRAGTHRDIGGHYTEYVKQLLEFDEYLGKYELEGLSLCENGIGEMISKAFKFYDGSLYEMHSFCVMPNHVHMLIRPLQDTPIWYHRVSDIVKRIKTYTSRQINQKQKHQGTVWQPDYFDRFIRNPENYYNVVRYIMNNPVKAGLAQRLEDWKYSYYVPSLM